MPPAADPHVPAEPAGRTDLHAHILPGLDDGARDPAEALAMAQVAVAEGIVCVAATPHSLRWPPGTDPEALEAHIVALRQRLAAAGVRLEVVAGAEMPLIAALPQQLDAGDCVTLNRSRYLLLELPYAGLPGGLEEILFQVQARSFLPILAHPERNADLARDADRLRRLVEQGTLVQITAASLEGRFGAAVRRAAERYLRANLVHVIATDAHDPRDRAPRLAAAEALAARIVGPARARAMVATTPAAILAAEELEVEPPAPSTRRRWFW